jgi:hypothetical protein
MAAQGLLQDGTFLIGLDSYYVPKSTCPGDDSSNTDSRRLGVESFVGLLAVHAIFLFVLAPAAVVWEAMSRRRKRYQDARARAQKDQKQVRFEEQKEDGGEKSAVTAFGDVIAFGDVVDAVTARARGSRSAVTALGDAVDDEDNRRSEGGGCRQDSEDTKSRKNNEGKRNARQDQGFSLRVVALPDLGEGRGSSFTPAEWHPNGVGAQSQPKRVRSPSPKRQPRSITNRALSPHSLRALCESGSEPEAILTGFESVLCLGGSEWRAI